MRTLIKQLKEPHLNTRIKRMLGLTALAFALLLSTNCGKRKPPLPPVERIPQRVAVTGSQIGDQIVVTWQMPARNAKDGSTLNITRADIYRLAEPLKASLSLTEEEFAAKSTLIATVPIVGSDFSLKEKTFVDKLRFSGQAARLRYAIRFVNASGQRAAFSNFLIVEPSPKIARQPTSLSVQVSQEQLTLTWKSPQSNVDGSTPVNILGYNLYRTSEKTSLKRLNEKPFKDTEFTDAFFEFATAYKYFVRTVSLGSNGQEVESVDSEFVEVTPKDTFPPAAPDAITIAAAPNNISIFFAVNLEKDVVGYRVFRSTNPKTPKDKWQLLTATPLITNTYQDSKVESGRNYYYYLTAIDKFGNESQPSEVVSETAF